MVVCTKTTRNITSLFAAAVLLTACGGGDSSPTPTPTPVQTGTPPPTPPAASFPDLTQAKLLTDAELQTPAISPAPEVRAAYADWMSANAIPIRSITYDADFSDLEFLSNLIGNKDIVQLGESSHGTKEFNHVKTRLIKYLHQKLGFSVVSFESGFFDGFEADRSRASLSADQEMRFIFSVWHTNEVFELFRYAQETQSTSSPLRFTGFDTQISSGLYGRISAFVSSIPETTGLTPLLKASVQQNFTQFRSMQANFSQNSCFSQQTAVCDGAVSDGEAIRQNLSDDLVGLEPIAATNPDLRALYISVLAAISQVDNSLASYRTNDTGDVRDGNMATIFQAVRSDVVPGEKIVIWAHNRHIAYGRSPTTPVNSIRNYPVQAMGFHLREALPDNLFTIGLYMLRGETAGNSRDAVSVLAPKPNSLEAIAHSARMAAFFMNTSASQTQNAGNAFLFERTQAHYWGGTFGSYTMVPSDQYDGIIVIDQSSVPSYR